VGDRSEESGSEFIEEELLPLKAFSKLVDLHIATFCFSFGFFFHLFLQVDDT